MGRVTLAHECARPLLIVQADAGNLKTMTILLSSEHVNENYINACLDFADSFHWSLFYYASPGPITKRRRKP